MSVEEKLIPTRTEYQASLGTVSISSIYDEDNLPDTIQGRIADEVGVQDGTSYIENELLLKTKHNPDHLYYDIDPNGNLILVINTGDENKYAIDDDGNLTYTS